LKIAIASDLHLEFGDLEFDNSSHADVLILSGDILVARDITQHDPYNVMGTEYRSNRYHNFMQRCCEQFAHVIYVMGNHEHYHHDFAKTASHLKDVLGYLKNLYILEREVKVIDAVTFVGGTVWTDMNREDPLTLYHMKSMMNDFRIISNSNKTVNYRSFDDVDNPDKPTFRTRAASFSPEDSVEQHRQSVAYIQHIVEGRADQKFVVVGHHAPSRLSTHAQYVNDTVMNGAYSSDLDEFIENHPQIRLWTHGHTHHPFDYTIGKTRVLCNPRGYINHEPAASDFKLLTVDV
jgi:predicted phosphodiesterase